MAGAGTSLSRYGSWVGVLEGLGDLAVAHGRGFVVDAKQRAEDPLGYAEDAKLALQAAGEEARYFDFLLRKFGPQPDQFGEFHELLVSLPICGMMTTNYDPCFVATIAKLVPGSFNAQRILRGDAPGAGDDWLTSLNSSTSGLRLVLHCHGYYLSPHAIVLGTDDYRELYGDQPPVDLDGGPGFRRIQTSATREAEILRGVFTHRPVVFVGFSMTDPYFRAMIEFVMRALWRFDPARSNTVVILADSERRMRAALRALGEGEFAATDYLEDRNGAPSIALHVTLRLKDGTATLDYAGTAGQLDYPLNAVYGVTLSGAYYALRAVTDAGIPMNDGCFRPVTVNVPEGTLLNPRRPAPVSGGNVETSTRNADLVLQSLAKVAPERVPGCSGGTMSNVMLGGTTSRGQTWVFYETNGCGLGARPSADGIDGIQCHMTNTLNTPIDALERYYPLRVTRYEFAEDTCVGGHFRGGRGLIRALQLVDGTARCSLLADRHTLAPSGANGGESGAVGSHTLIRGARREKLPAKTTLALTVGDIIEVQTPGGGGYGAPTEQS